MHRNFLLPVALALVIAGCASAPPQVALLPEISPAESPEPPPSENLSVYMQYRRANTDYATLMDNTVYRNGFRIKPGASVVISVPLEQQLEGQRRDLREDMRSGYWNIREDIAEKDTAEYNRLMQQMQGDDTSFRTAEYFNKAEQEIEKSLLRKSFTVLDRSKFEAKLREQRTTTKDEEENLAKDEEIKALQEQRDTKQITREEFVERLKDVESKYNILNDSNTRHAGDNELVDISELIRAAQSAGVQADYILQVNTFKIDAISDKQIDLFAHPEMSSRLDSHPGLADAMASKGIRSIVQPGYFGYLNAKLIDVKTGEIVWVGEHRVDTSNVENFKIDLRMSRQVANVQLVNQEVNNYNYQLRNLYEEARKLRTSTQVQGLDKDDSQRRVRSYNQSLINLNQLQQQGPSVPPWEYAYFVSQPETTPSFPSSFEVNQLKMNSMNSQAEQNRYIEVRNQLDRHHTALAKMVSKELINTIPN